MPSVKIPVRLLQPGDIVRQSAERAVVLCIAAADPGPVGLQLGRLGEIPPHLSRVATVAWDPGHLVDVELGQRVDQATVDRHLDAVLRASGSALRHYSMPKTLEDMRAAMRAAMGAGDNAA